MNKQKLYSSTRRCLFTASALSALMFGSVAQALDLNVAPAQVRTLEMVNAMDAEIAALGLAPANDRDTTPRPNRNDPDYAAAKAAANLSPQSARPEQSQLAPPTYSGVNFAGVGQAQAGNLRPPDTHGAIGKTRYCQIVNSYIQCYRKASPFNIKRSNTLAAFFGYTAQTLFDPRIVYDHTWNRWVAFAEAFEESATVQRIFFAISVNPNPDGAWYVYNVDINVFNNDDFFDYGDIGMTQDAVVLTWNNFGPAAFRDARMLSIAKASLYNGLGWSTPVRTGYNGTLRPNIVLDQSPDMHLVSSNDITGATGTGITVYTLHNAAFPFSATVTSTNITLPYTWGFPSDAAQPGTTALLDTLNGRFVNAGTQVGNNIYQVHTIGPGLPTPRWLRIDTATMSVPQTGVFYASGLSNDFNASIAANRSGQVAAVWTSTCPDACTTKLNAQTRFTGEEAGNPLTGPGLALFTSPSYYTGGRWGDYSAVSFDLSLNPNMAWVTNEEIVNTATWGTRIGRVRW